MEHKKPTHEKFTVELSTGRTLEMRELNGLEQINADMCAPENAPMGMGVYYRIAMSITSIDGEKIEAVESKDNLHEILEQLRGIELDEIVKKYYTHVREKYEMLPKE